MWWLSIFKFVTYIYIVLHVLIPKKTSCFMTTPMGFLYTSLKCLPIRKNLELWHKGTTLETSPNTPITFVDINDNHFFLTLIMTNYPTTSMKTNSPTISPIGIDGNTHTPPVTNSSLMFLSPFDINGKWYLPLGFLPLSSYF